MILRSVAVVLFVALLTSAQTSLNPSASRMWTNDSGKWINAEFLEFQRGMVKLRRDDGKIGHFPFDRLTRDDQLYVMETTGWGRVWTNADGKYFIADFVRLEGEKASLEDPNGKTIDHALSTLSGLDQHYIRARAGGAIAPDSPILKGKVVGISDGDTLTLLVNKRQYKVRLEGIDCPERNQDYGTRAREFLADTAFGKEVDVINFGMDKYKRTVGRVFCNGVDVNAALVEAGLAWHYKEYSNEKLVADLETKAREQQIGLWSQPNPIPPWEFRRYGSGRSRQFADVGEQSKGNQPRAPTTKSLGQGDFDYGKMSDGTLGRSELTKAPPQDTQSTQSAGSELTHWLNTSTDVRHNRSCPWFNNTKRGRYCTSQEGSPCAQCGG